MDSQTNRHRIAAAEVAVDLTLRAQPRFVHHPDVRDPVPVIIGELHERDTTDPFLNVRVGDVWHDLSHKA